MSANLNQKNLIRALEEACDFVSEIIIETEHLADIDNELSSDPLELKVLQKLRTKISQATEDCNFAKDELSTNFESLSNICSGLHSNSKVLKDFNFICADKSVCELLKAIKTRLRVLQKNKIAVNDAILDEKERFSQVTQSIVQKNSNVNSNSVQYENILSPISLQTFDGSPEKFLEYITIFDELVHNNLKMSNLKKAVYLKNSLIGSAAMKISGIPAIGSNYQRMYDILRRKFDNIPVNQNSIVQKLENLSPAEFSSDSCTKTLDQITSYVNQICSSGLDISNSNVPLWLRLIYRKFPPQIVEKIMNDNCRESMFCVQNLIDELENAIFTKAFIENNNISNNSESKPCFPVYSNQGQHSNNANHRSTSNCILCTGSHPARKCLNITNPEEMLHILKQNRACWKCFETGHSSFYCEEQDCFKCGKKHNIKLCHKPNTGSSNFNSARVNHVCEQITDKSKLPDMPDNFEIPSFVVQHSIKETPKYDRIALMTIEAEVLNKDSKEYEKVTVFFDNGSQGTFVSEALVEKLKLPIQTEEQISLVGVNGIPERFMSKSVNLKLKTLSGEDINLEAKSKHTITAGFRAPILLPYDNVHLRDRKIKLSMAKHNGEFIKPDILIGLDNYSDFVLNERKEMLPTGYMLADTVLEKTIYGNCKKLDNSDFVGCCIRIIEDKSMQEMINIGRSIRSQSRGLSSGPRLADKSSASHSVSVNAAAVQPNSIDSNRHQSSSARLLQSQKKTSLAPP